MLIIEFVFKMYVSFRLVVNGGHCEIYPSLNEIFDTNSFVKMSYFVII